MSKYDKTLSEAISFIRFPLAVMVVLIHATLIYELNKEVQYVNDANTPLYSCVDFLFRQSICSLAVPIFFFISGFLFFWNVDGFCFGIYKRKIKSRFYSLLIPYLFWNLLILVYVYTVQQVFPGMMSAKNKLVSDYSITDFLYCFWNMSYVNNGGGDFPIDGPLWFIRDLIIMNLLSPLVYWCLARLKKIGAFILILLWFFDVLNVLGNFSTAILFYSFGAYWGIWKLNILEKTANYYKVFMGGYLILLILAVIFKNSNMAFLVKVEQMFGFVTMWWLAVLCSRKYHFGKLLTGSTFILFAIHSDILKVIIKLFFKVMPMRTDGILVVAYFVLAAIAIILSLILFWLLNRYTPKFCQLISGGR